MVIKEMSSRGMPLVDTLILRSDEFYVFNAILESLEVLLRAYVQEHELSSFWKITPVFDSFRSSFTMADY
jgi:hypothetical protein